MDFIIRLFGPPHEYMHVLALRLIGRRPRSVGRQHVDIPEDLTVGQYVFVAGLPALVFWGIGAVGLVFLLNPPNLPSLVLGMVLLLIGGLGGLGTLGDLQLIYERLMEGDDNR